MAIEIRHPAEDELARRDACMTTSAFGDAPSDEDFERHRKMLRARPLLRGL